jgi:RNA 2',3'-cyclic 3'-phosphodiesterase
MHTFFSIGVPIPSNIAQTLSHFFYGIPGAAWTNPDALHIPLRFLGSKLTPADQIDLGQCLENIMARSFHFEIAGCDLFHQNQHVYLILKGRPNKALSDLKHRLDLEIKEFDIKALPNERGHFFPYIPLAEVSKNTPSHAIASYLSDLATLSFDPIPISSIALYSSLGTASQYECYAEYPFSIDQTES